MKNKTIQRNKVFGKTAMPSSKSAMRDKHMKHIQEFVKRFFGIDNRVTKGKYNSAGKFIKKPDWTTGFLEYEPNPDAAVHEIAHLALATEGLGLGDIQKDMDAQFGFCQSSFGYMQQKRSIFEVFPMGMEQLLRRRMGLPASTKFVKVDESTPVRVAAEDNKTPIAKRINKNGKLIDLIRLSSNLDAGARERMEMIDNGEIVFDLHKGWVESNTIDAKINRRARLAKKRRNNVIEVNFKGLSRSSQAA